MPLRKGIGTAIGTADCIVYNEDAMLRELLEPWVGRYGRSTKSPRAPVDTEIGETRRANREAIADTQGAEGDQRPTKSPGYFTPSELSENLLQFGDTVARCVTLALRKRPAAVARRIDRNDIEQSLAVELYGILRAYKPRTDATINTYVWGCLTKRVNSVIERELHGEEISADDDIPEESPIAGHNRTEVKLSIDAIVRQLDPTERRVFQLYFVNDPPATQTQIAGLVGRSQAWVSDILAVVKKKFRDGLIISAPAAVNKGERTK
jgi:RNA polymerase sigma factor (sigma-70 family)